MGVQRIGLCGKASLIPGGSQLLEGIGNPISFEGFSHQTLQLSTSTRWWMGTWVHRLIKFGVWGLGASVWGVGFRVAGLGFAIGSCAGIHCSRIMREHLATILQCRKEDARLPGKGDLNFHGARPVHLIITMTRRIRTSRLSTKNSRSSSGNAGCAAQICQLLCRTVTGLTRSVSPKTLNERERERECER